MTLLKNEGNVLPLDGNSGKHTLILVNNQYRRPSVEYAVDRLQREGLLDASSVTIITEGDGVSFESAEVQEALSIADQLIILSQSAIKLNINDQAIKAIHQKGGQAILLSLNLPYDAGTYDDVDAILCAYQYYGNAHDEEGNGPFNLNLAVAVCTAFGQFVPQGKLPVNVPVVENGADGSANFLDDILYSRGFGLDNWGSN